VFVLQLGNIRVIKHFVIEISCVYADFYFRLKNRQNHDVAKKRHNIDNELMGSQLTEIGAESLPRFFKTLHLLPRMMLTK